MPGADSNRSERIRDLALQTKNRPRSQKPPAMYQVVVLNDDVTPMGYVVSMLQRLFCLPEPKANELMYRVHNQGRAVCGQYTFEVADFKARQVVIDARTHQYPLNCCIEPAS